MPSHAGSAKAKPWPRPSQSPRSSAGSDVARVTPTQHAEVAYQLRSTNAAAALTPAAAPSPASSSSSHAGSHAGIGLPSARAAEAAAPTQIRAANHASSVPRPRVERAGGCLRAGGLIMPTRERATQNDGLVSRVKTRGGTLALRRLGAETRDLGVKTRHSTSQGVKTNDGTALNGTRQVQTGAWYMVQGRQRSAKNAWAPSSRGE